MIPILQSWQDAFDWFHRYPKGECILVKRRWAFFTKRIHATSMAQADAFFS